MREDPSAGIDLSIAQQEEWGVPFPKALPNAAAKETADNLEQTPPGQERVMAMEELAAQYGDKLPMVIGQLTRDAGLKPEFTVLGNVDIKNSVRSELSQAYSADGIKGVLDKSSSDIASKVAVKADKFLDSDADTNIELVQGYFQAVERLAAYRMLKGEKLGPAAESAFSDLIESNYSFQKIGGKNTRIPAKHDPVQIKRDLRRALRSISIEDVQFAPAIEADENLRGMAFNDLSDNGSFLLNEQEDGFYLMLPYANGNRTPVRTADGKSLIEFKIEDLSGPTQ